jgi:hypothetical protein
LSQACGHPWSVMRYILLVWCNLHWALRLLHAGYCMCGLCVAWVHPHCMQPCGQPWSLCTCCQLVWYSVRLLHSGSPCEAARLHGCRIGCGCGCGCGCGFPTFTVGCQPFSQACGHPWSVMQCSLLCLCNPHKSVGCCMCGLCVGVVCGLCVAWVHPQCMQPCGHPWSLCRCSLWGASP